MEFRLESFGDCIEEIAAYLEGHADEVEKMPILPDFEAYARGQEMDSLKIFTMRKDGLLSGYAAFWLYPHPHHMGKLFATCDLIYVHPVHRGFITVDFLNWVEEQLEVDAIQYTLKVEHDHPALMEHLGMTHTEKVYTKVIG